MSAHLLWAVSSNSVSSSAVGASWHSAIIDNGALLQLHHSGPTLLGRVAVVDMILILLLSCLLLSCHQSKTPSLIFEHVNNTDFKMLYPTLTDMDIR